ncbi:DinB family protein, partial [Sphingobacterium thalpophilum]
MKPLKSDEYPAVYAPYIETVVDDNVLDALEEQILSFPAFLDSIPEERGNFKYAEDKWTIKEVVGHVIDNERIMAYRALRFSRNDLKELTGYDQDYLIQYSRYN